MKNSPKSYDYSDKFGFPVELSYKAERKFPKKEKKLRRYLLYFSSYNFHLDGEEDNFLTTKSEINSYFNGLYWTSSHLFQRPEIWLNPIIWAIYPLTHWIKFCKYKADLPYLVKFELFFGKENFSQPRYGYDFYDTLSTRLALFPKDIVQFIKQKGYIEFEIEQNKKVKIGKIRKFRINMIYTEAGNSNIDQDIKPKVRKLKRMGKISWRRNPTKMLSQSQTRTEQLQRG